jgi:hypothetical protein
MEKRLLNDVSTSGSVTIQDAVGIISLLLIGISLLIILYNILKWLIRVENKIDILMLDADRKNEEKNKHIRQDGNIEEK